MKPAVKQKTPLRCVVIGSGIGGMGIAALLAKKGYDVQVLEKNEQLGGRISVFEESSFTFDMGPSWYLMPEVFEAFYRELGEDVSSHLKLQKLSPSYRVYFEGDTKPVDIFSDYEKDAKTFERFEKGAAKKLKHYLDRSGKQYELIWHNFLRANVHGLKLYFSLAALKAFISVPLFGTMHRYVKRFFSNYRLQQLLQYPLVFLGSSPYNAPAMYNIMSHLDFTEGVFYPMGGMYTIIESLKTIGNKLGVRYRLHSPVEKILITNGRASGVKLANGEEISADIVISNADMTFTENHLLPSEYRKYSEKYWQGRTMAPSTFLMYLGIKGELPSLLHHTLYFSKDWQKNFEQIFDTPMWPEKPSIYISNVSKTDTIMAKPGYENVFVLVPIGAGVEDNDEQRMRYRQQILSTLQEELAIPDLQNRIVYEKMFGPRDYTERYNSFQGSALGLAHTLSQTAFLRPSHTSKLPGLYYVGSGVHPGIGMPVCLVSAQIAAESISNALQ